MKRLLSLVLLILCVKAARAQNFEGEIDYNMYHVNTATKDIAGTLTGGKNQFDIMAANLNTYAQCSVTTLAAKRAPANGKIPHIFYAPLSPAEPNTVISDINFDKERENIDSNNYISLGATFDNNDAFVAEVCNSVGYLNWVSIRNISDLPGEGSDSTYTQYQDCSSMIGGLAVYAFIAGH